MYIRTHHYHFILFHLSQCQSTLQRIYYIHFFQNSLKTIIIFPVNSHTLSPTALDKMAIFKNLFMSIAVATLAAQSTKATPIPQSDADWMFEWDNGLGCFHGGNTFSQNGFTDDSWISGACSQLSLGNFDDGQESSACIVTPDLGTRVNLFVKNLSGYTGPLTLDEWVTPSFFICISI